MPPLEPDIKLDPNTALDLGSLETEMNRGFLHILALALLEKDMYGYAMVRHVETLGYKVEENTLYPLLRRLEKNGWIASKWDLGEDRPRKFYAVTPAGRALRARLLELWRTQDRVLGSVLGSVLASDPAPATAAVLAPAPVPTPDTAIKETDHDR